MSARLKGTALEPSIDYIKTTYGEQVWAAVLDRLSDEQRNDLAFVQGANLYPVALPGAMISALVAIEFAGDRASADEALRKMGRHAADRQLSGIYSLFVRFSSPDKALARIEQVVTTLYDGATAELDYVAGETRGTVRIHGLGEFPYAAPRVCGWAERALERSGAKTAHVVERGWDAGRNASDDLVFDVVWT
ncbi:MAG TPA: hypothetical protein VIL41_03025 [Coriobacteriia bacterium]